MPEHDPNPRPLGWSLSPHLIMASVATEETELSDWVTRQVEAGQDSSRAYLHVGKTGGTSFLREARTLAAVQPERVPILFPHEWTVPRIRESLPDATISLIIRDPLERAVSGFVSRERAGRPTYNSPWNHQEATAFLFFKSVYEYLDAILSGNHRDAAAADFASRSIDHIRRGYEYHLGDAMDIGSWAGVIGRFENVQEFTSKVLGDDVNVGHLHRNPVSSAAVLERYTSDEIGQLRTYFQAEYEMFDALAPHAL